MPTTSLFLIFILVSVFFIVLLGVLATVIFMMYQKNRQKQLLVQQSSDFLMQIVYEDDITGLPTMPKFTMDIAPLLSCALPGEYSLVLFDVDNFKYVNDVFGYKTANRMLRCLARYLSGAVPQGTLITRVNADNFMMLCKSYHLDIFCQALDQFRVQDYFPEVGHLLGDNYTICFSMGTYLIQDSSRELAVMMDYASIAKKEGKEHYGNTTFDYSAAMDLEMQLRCKITVIMEKALADHEFIPYLQPQYSLVTGALTGAEMLARWHSSSLGSVFPSEFIPLFERNGFIRKLDLFMFEQACMLIRGWLDQGIQPIPCISVNASKLTVTIPTYLDSLSEILARYKIDSSMIEIELTESVLGDKPDEILTIMAGLKAMGFFVSLDDFGKGYSSLNLLKDIPADVLKIDRGFITDTMHTQRGQDIIASVIAMSKKLQLHTVAEGIETLSQADCLRGMGCDVAQGFYFARPMPSQDFERILRGEKNQETVPV